MLICLKHKHNKEKVSIDNDKHVVLQWVNLKKSERDWENNCYLPTHLKHREILYQVSFSQVHIKIGRVT